MTSPPGSKTVIKQVDRDVEAAGGPGRKLFSDATCLLFILKKASFFSLMIRVLVSVSPFSSQSNQMETLCLTQTGLFAVTSLHSGAFGVKCSDQQLS